MARSGLLRMMVAHLDRTWLDSRVVLLGYLALSLLAYAPVISAFFLSDDFVYLREIARQPWPDVLLLQPGVFRPLHVLTWLVDHRLWGLNPVGYHLTNIVSHGLTSFVVYLVARDLFAAALGPADATWASMLAGLVFALHPSHTEAVAWIIGRHDILATLFLLLSWLAYMRVRLRPRPLLLPVALAAFLIALLFKESVITFPLLLAAYEAWLWTSKPSAARGSLARSMALPSLYLIVVALYLLIRRTTSGELVGGYEAAFVRPSSAMFANLAITVFRSYAPYVPVQLLPEPPRIGLTGLTTAALGMVAVLVAVTFVYRTWARPTQPRLLLGLLLVSLVLSTAPTLAAAPSVIDSESERFTYLPSVFASITVALVVFMLAKRGAVRVLLGAGILLFMGAFLELSNQNWSTAGEVARSTLASLRSELETDGEIVVVVPDNLNGAFIFRNGLPEAVELFASQPGTRVEVAGRVFLQWPDDAVAIERVDTGRYAVSLPSTRGALHINPLARFRTRGTHCKPVPSGAGAHASGPPRLLRGPSACRHRSRAEHQRGRTSGPPADPSA